MSRLPAVLTLAIAISVGAVGTAQAQPSSAKPLLIKEIDLHKFAKTMRALASDPEALQSGLTSKKTGPSAPKPDTVKVKYDANTADTGVSPGAPTDDEIRKELKEMNQVLAQQKRELKNAGTGLGLTHSGRATVPDGAPEVIAQIVAAGNAIAKYPYVLGGGHTPDFVDSAYDCSGSVSYALAAAGLVDKPYVSGSLAKWGKPGRGKWLTLYANAAHVYMVVGNLRFDTSFRDGPRGTRWQTGMRTGAGFKVRHWPGL